MQSQGGRRDGRRGKIITCVMSHDEAKKKKKERERKKVRLL